MSLVKKQLINITEQQKEWIGSVVDAAEKQNVEINQTTVIRALIDQAMANDPENFVQQLTKIRVRAQLDDISRREEELKEEKERLLEVMEAGGERVHK